MCKICDRLSKRGEDFSARSAIAVALEDLEEIQDAVMLVQQEVSDAMSRWRDLAKLYAG